MSKNSDSSIDNIIGKIDPDQEQCFCCEKWFPSEQVFYRLPGTIKKLDRYNVGAAYICVNCTSLFKWGVHKPKNGTFL